MLTGLPSQPRVRWVRPALALTLLAAMLLPARALELREARWGFDNHTTPDGFTLLSLRVANPTRAPFDGDLRLRPLFGMGPQSSAYVQPCYVAPGGERWVQVVVFTTSGQPSWDLFWREGSQTRREKLDQPAAAAPARVLLDDATAVGAGRGLLPRFPDDLFPPMVAALDGLEGVVLDHVPRWEPARRAAFLAWLEAGGRVHLLRDAQGDWPLFADDLAVLNGARASGPARVGAGVVMRHDATRHTLDADGLAAAGFSMPVLAAQSDPARSFSSFITATRPVLRSHHPWGLIYLILVLYILLAGPGVLIAARRWRRTWPAWGVLLGSILFGVVALRLLGYQSERQTSFIATLSTARPAGDGLYRVTDWSLAFAGRGGTYAFAHAGPHQAYAPWPMADYLAWNVRAGRDGAFLADVPINAHCLFLHEGLLPGPRMDLRVRRAPQDGGTLAGLEIECAGNSHLPPGTHAAWAVRGTVVRPLRVRGDALVADALSTAGQLEPFLASHAHSTATFDVEARTNQVDSERAFTAAASNLVGALMATALRGTVASSAVHSATWTPAAVARTSDRLQLFILAPSPAGFAPVSPAFHRFGQVLYHVDLDLPEAPRPGKQP